MRIALVVTGGVDRSGRERVIPVLLGLIERLARRHAVTVYALRYHDRPCRYPLLGATVQDLGRPEGVRAQHVALHRALDEDGPFDVVHAYWAVPAGLAASAAARRLRIPSVVTMDSGEFVALDDIGYGLQRTWRHRLAVRLTARLATAVTVCSEQMAALAAAHGVVARRVPIGVDVSQFFPATPADAPPWRLLNVASLNAVKDHPTLLQALRALVDAGCPVHLDVVGEDTRAGEMTELARRLALERHVTFHGFQPTGALSGFYQRAHVHVVSSRHEAACVAVVEAAAAGVPTVGTAVGYVADWAPHRAVAVPTGDPAALAHAIRCVLEDGAGRRRIGEAAASWARAHDAAWSADQFESLYEEIARRPALQRRPPRAIAGTR